MEQRVSLITLGVGDLLLARRFYEEGLSWEVGNHQGMPRRNRKTVLIHEEVRVPGDDPGFLWLAEGALGAGVAFHA